MTFRVRPRDVDAFRDLVGRRLGLHFEAAKLGVLADVLGRRVEARGCSCEQYLDLLARGFPSEELTGLAQELTVGETYFFRQSDQFRAFSSVAMPDRMVARAAERKLRILSAGCASGEEPYTLAMLVRGLALDSTWEVSIRAVDLNPAMLGKAAGARFSSWSLRETPPDMQTRWFRSSGDEFLLDDSIVAQVLFEQRNLAEDDPALWSPASFDVVFCRNVIMYFTPSTAQAVVDRISRSLAPGGYLFLGYAENLRGMSHDFHLRHTHDAFYFQRKPQDELVAPPSESRRMTASPSPVAATAPFDMPTDSWMESIEQSSARVRVLSDRREGCVKATGARAVSRSLSRCDLRPPNELLRQERFAHALELLREERFVQALELIRALPTDWAVNPDVRLLEAVLLAHCGELDRAEKTSLELLEIDELNAGAHYVLALCRDGCGDPGGAAVHDQIASHLDPSFAMPRLHLGLLARRAGERARARRELGQALVLLQREDPSRLLFFGGGFGRAALADLCRAELVACGGRP